MTKPVLGMNIPIIGSRPPPEAIEEAMQKMATMEMLWPVTPFPMSGNGIKVPAYWMGQTLLDAFALKAMESLDWKNAVNNGRESTMRQAKRAWLIASAMLETRPIGRAPSGEVQDEKAQAPNTPESSGTDTTPPENSGQESGQKLVTL